MLAYPIATALLLLEQGSAAAGKTSTRARKPHPQKPNFLRKMDGHKEHARRRLSVKDFQAELYGDSKNSAELRKKVIEKSTMVKPPGSDGTKRKLQNNNNQANGSYNNYGNGNNANGYNQRTNGYNANGSYNTYNNAYRNGNNNKNNADNPYNNGGNYVYDEDGNIKYKYNADRDGSDDWFQAYGDWENAFGFDPTQFSLSYHRCAAVKQYDDEIAASEDTDSVFATKRFAIFRFCPARTCMGWEEEEEEWECDEDTYGEYYCAALEEYMQVMEEMAANYQQYGNGWNGYGQNGGNAQANNWMDVNDGNYQNNGNVQYDQYGNPYWQQYANGQQQDCECEQNADDDGEEQECECKRYAYGQYQQEEEEEQWGARGAGCQSNYGEYMMEMEEYLAIMLEWQEERFEQYCMYCEECMYDVYEVWLQNGGEINRKLEFEEFKEEHRNLDGGYAKNNYYQVCPEFDTCTEYAKICNQGMVDEFSDYFECTQVEASSGQVAYIGPHCSEDGFTISVAVYADEYCNEYIGNGVDIANFLGMEIDYEEDLFREYYNSAYGATLDQLQYINEENVCIPCRGNDLMWTERENNNGGDDDDEVNYDGNEINELCEKMYLVTARCDKHFRSYNNKSKQAKYAEAVAQEDLTCDFIDSIVMGNYNEMGEIDMGGKYNAGMRQGWLANSMYAQQLGQSISKVTPLQLFLLISSIGAVSILALWSVSLHKSLTKAGPWRPRRGLRSAAPAQNNATAAGLSHQNSGICVGRSNSNTSYYMS